MPICSKCGRESDGDFAFCPHCAAPLKGPEPSREQRKTVTVLFCDVTGSTALGESTDPEALRAVLARYFERMKWIIESHGGTVEKFIGDAVMAVFGVPQVHEDDALRACRAAVEMRDALPELGLAARIGLNTGEVVTGTEERLATGDAVNVAARLEQAAQPGEILIGAETFALVRDAVETEPTQPLELKGKADAVSADRVVAVTGELTRRHVAPMVGREREQRLLGEAWVRVVSERACYLFTILGSAGVGKSRLASEFLQARDDATVVGGRCLPYGDGITYGPIVEVLTQLPPADLERHSTPPILDLLAGGAPASSSEELAWSFRKLLEAVAASRPLVCVLDDLQWGEETFLDLVEHVADLSRDAPIMLLCMARPDLLDRRPSWGGGKINATTVLLDALPPEETERLLDQLGSLDAELRQRILTAAEGNPLFVEEMVALVREATNGDVTVPPTIQALLAARLDQLADDERTILQCGSVEGRVFHRGAVEALAPRESGVTTRLTALVRKELVRPDRPQLAGDDAFRFRHLLIRDAAYDALPKTERAALHERFAEWLEAHGDQLLALDEILGYHLGQAHDYRRELGVAEEDVAELGARAAARLSDAGRRAFRRSDMPAASNLLQRAATLWPRDDVRKLDDLGLFGRALLDQNEWERAGAVLSEVVDSARAQGEDGIAAHATVALAFQWIHTDLQANHERVERDLEDAVTTFERLDDVPGLASAF